MLAIPHANETSRLIMYMQPVHVQLLLSEAGGCAVLATINPHRSSPAKPGRQPLPRTFGRHRESPFALARSVLTPGGKGPHKAAGLFRKFPSLSRACGSSSLCAAKPCVPPPDSTERGFRQQGLTQWSGLGIFIA